MNPAAELIEKGAARFYDINTNTYNFRAIQDIVLIRPAEKMETESALIHFPKEKSLDGFSYDLHVYKVGEIVAIGPGRTLEDGSFLATALKVGDRVIYNQNLQMEYAWRDEVFALTREREILAVLDAENN